MPVTVKFGVWQGFVPGTAILPHASKTLAEVEKAGFEHINRNKPGEIKGVNSANLR